MEVLKNHFFQRRFSKTFFSIKKPSVKKILRQILFLLKRQVGNCVLSLKSAMVIKLSLGLVGLHGKIRSVCPEKIQRTRESLTILFEYEKNKKVAKAVGLHVS